MTYQKKCGTLTQGAHPGSYNGQDAYNDMLVTTPERGGARMGNDHREKQSAYQRQESGNQVEGLQRPTSGLPSDEEEVYVARRLTPGECCRLQGFPDGWCDDVPHSDSAEYKLWGNGIALPCLLPMLKAMKEVLEEGEH